MRSDVHPYIFDEFFASGREETISPFLTPSSRKWGKNLPLKSAIIAAILLALSFGLFFFHKEASYLCLSSVYFLVGTPALLNSIEDLRNMEINIDVLMTLAALLSIIIGSGLEGALLLVLFELSGAMENMVTEKTKGALYSLRKLSPKTALVVETDGTFVERAINEVEIGAPILVKAGEVVPLDGTVISGSSFVNLVHLTGESEPIAKRVEDTVQAGAYNLDGTLTLKVDRAASESTLSRIITLITQAQGAKPKLQRLFDKFGKRYSVTIILLSLFFALTFPYFFSIPFFGIEGSVYRALTFLIAASPCALIIATPTAYLSAISSCARKGVLLKGGVILDALASCSIIALDKTGTLTSGKLTCVEVAGIHNAQLPTQTALAIAAGLETHAVHPISEAILTQAAKQNVLPSEITDFKSVPGYGLQGNATIDGTSYPVFIGHPDFIAQQLDPALWMEKIGPWKTLNTFLLIGTSLYIFHFEDEIRKESFAALSSLQNEKNMKPVILTGDHTENAHVVADTLNIKTIYPNLRPEDKLKKVGELSKEGGLIMVGDGVNDAPALARATVGISMGKIGSATAVDASDVVFLHDDLSLLPWLIDKSRKTLRIVKENLALALAVICFATTPALLGYIPLWLAVILHEGGTVIVGLNSLRLLATDS